MVDGIKKIGEWASSVTGLWVLGGMVISTLVTVAVVVVNAVSNLQQIPEIVEAQKEFATVLDMKDGRSVRLDKDDVDDADVLSRLSTNEGMVNTTLTQLLSPMDARLLGIENALKKLDPDNIPGR